MFFFFLNEGQYLREILQKLKNFLIIIKWKGLLFSVSWSHGRSSVKIRRQLCEDHFFFTTWCQWLNNSSGFHGKCFKSLSHRLKPKITLPLCFIWLYNFNLLSIYQIIIFYYVLTLLHQVYIKLLCQWNKSDWNEIMNIISWKSLYLPQSMIPALLALELQN